MIGRSLKCIFATSLMIQLKKPLLIAMFLAVIVSPLIPFARANDGQWGSAIAKATWNYDLYRVERLALGKNVQGPFEYHDGVFVTEPATSSVVMTLLKNGQALPIKNVISPVSSAFWQSAQNDRFIYTVGSSDTKTWGTVFAYDAKTGITDTLGEIVRNEFDINYLTSAIDGSRVYSSILHTQDNTSDIKMKLAVTDTDTGYTHDDFTWSLNAPWQEIVDVQDNVVLVKFMFDGGFTQLILINEQDRTIKEIPSTWTEPGGSLVGAHFLTNGTIRYFQNYRLYTYTPGAESPVESGGAYLNWFMDAQQAVQFAGDRMAYVDPENTLYVTGVDGVANYGKALNGVFVLDTDAIYYQSPIGFVSYAFKTKSWNTHYFLVTDSYEDILIGKDAQGTIWYENTTSGKTVNIGFGTNPVLTDREHAVWKGTDGHIYQATFASILDLGNAQVEALRAYGSTAVYLKSGETLWSIPDATTYFTWFDSWADVISVPPQTLSVQLKELTYLGNAPFAPGTRVKTVSNPKVYVSGTDGSLHWIVSETVADSIYGSTWNQDIIEVPNQILWNYVIGNHINSHADIKMI